MLVLPIVMASGGLQREFDDEQCAFIRGLGAVQSQSSTVDCYEISRLDVPVDPRHL